jgi:PPOX class probable F420-dependent enzyme
MRRQRGLVIDPRMHHSPMAAADALTQAELAFLAAARSAVLGTVAADGRPRLVPICFAFDAADTPLRIWSPLDEKPKRVADVHDLERVRDISANPAVSLLVHAWSEDWTALGWLRLDGLAELIEPGEAATSAEHHMALAALRARYPQYADHRLERRPIIRILIQRHRSWGNLGAVSA